MLWLINSTLARNTPFQGGGAIYNRDSFTNGYLYIENGTIANNAPIIGTYVHGIFDSPEILRRLLNTTAETHNLPQPVIEEFSMEAEYDRLAQITRENLNMPLINSLIQ